MKKHELHKKIGDLINSIDIDNIEKLLDPACGGNQNIPLFLAENKSRETRICWVDIMIVKNKKIKIIIEIEESNVKPIQILGKFMASAIAKYYIHETHNNEKIPMDDEVCFIQILDTKKLEEGSGKKNQWKNIESAIIDILPTLRTNIKTYKLFYGDFKNINLNEISNFIENNLIA